jgi:hypothetical protein
MGAASSRRNAGYYFVSQVQHFYYSRLITTVSFLMQCVQYYESIYLLKPFLRVKAGFV